MMIKENKTMPKQKIHYVLYCRKSTESEDQQIQSIEDQERVLTEFATQKNLPIIKTFKESMSAKQPGRPIFNEMVSYVHKRGDIAGLVLWQLNRGSRNPIDTATMQWMLQTGVITEIVTPAKTYLDYDSDLVMGVEGAMANRFIRELRANTKRGLDSKLEKGLAPILAPPGYKNNIHKKQGEKDISPHPRFFPLMRKVFERFMIGDISVRQLVSYADSLGLRNSRSLPISKTQMSLILRNPFYLGRFIYKGELYLGKHKKMMSASDNVCLSDCFCPNSSA